jgi:cytochrome b561
VLYAVVALHVLAALKHHFMLKDNVLKRMLPFT